MRCWAGRTWSRPCWARCAASWTTCWGARRRRRATCRRSWTGCGARTRRCAAPCAGSWRSSACPPRSWASSRCPRPRCRPRTSWCCRRSTPPPGGRGSGGPPARGAARRGGEEGGARAWAGAPGAATAREKAAGWKGGGGTPFCCRPFLPFPGPLVVVAACLQLPAGRGMGRVLRTTVVFQARYGARLLEGTPASWWAGGKGGSTSYYTTIGALLLVGQ
mmetsp:Transcript_34238/g.56478  ORF Transcript_34238/g.56478 Transcript_34238/m.56478 type:complete len:219 (+) Transcript_34238:1235-1891(+)